MKNIRSLLLLLLVATAACSAFDGDDYDDVLFLVQASPQAVGMQALYKGSVVRRGECLRLGGEPDGATVVWPHGFRLGGPTNAFVMDANGRAIGHLGERFTLSGGEVPTLDGIDAVADEVREAAVARCPGRYWLVGQTG